MPRKDGAARRAYRGPRDLETHRPPERGPGKPQGDTIADAPPAEEGLEENPHTLRIRMIPADVFLGDGQDEGIIDLPPEERADAIRSFHESPTWTEEDERKWQHANRT